jgi:rhomboid family GlyGly-CTERM serine protease
MFTPLHLRFRTACRPPRFPAFHSEVWFFLALLAFLNLHIVFPRGFAPLAFEADRLAAGEWWRMLAHPFVHVSWYHLLLDGSAFLLLHAGLAERRMLRRLALAAGSAGGALLAAALSDEGAVLGFCGLSGAAHGLMAATALEMLAGADRGLRRAGALLFAGVAAKSVLEAATGECFFSFLHFGLMGSPVAVSHLGGFLGGVLSGAAIRFLDGARGARKALSTQSRNVRFSAR